MLRRAAVEGNRERLVLDFFQALVRQKTTRFKKFVRELRHEEVEQKWINDEPYRQLDGFKAMDAGEAEGSVLADAWSWAVTGAVNVLCEKDDPTQNWKKVISKWSVINEEGKVKLGHKRMMQKGDRIFAVLMAFREDEKQLKKDLRKIKKLDEMPDDKEMVEQLVLRLEKDVRKALEDKLKADVVAGKEVTMERVVKHLKKKDKKEHTPLPWSREDDKKEVKEKKVRFRDQTPAATPTSSPAAP